MIGMMQFATLVMVTVFAAGAAVLFHSLLLEMTFRLMRPATAKRVPARTGLARGTAQVARAFSAGR